MGIARRQELVALALLLAALPAWADEAELPCAAPLPTVEAVGQCLGASHVNGGPWSILATTPSARLVRAGNPQDPTVYVVALRAGGWAAVAAVAYEAGHGRRRAELRAGAASETSLGARVVARFDVHLDDAITDDAPRPGHDDGSASTTVSSERSIFCVIGGRCVTVITECQASRTVDDAESQEVNAQHGHVGGRAQLGADGVITLTTTQRQDQAGPCHRDASAPAAQRLWSEPPAAADTPRWTAPRVCTVAAERLHFVDAQTLTPQRAYVVRGDRVDVTPRLPDHGPYVVARFAGPQKLTVGLLAAHSLDCKAASP